MQVKLPEPLVLICPTGRFSIPRTPPDLSPKSLSSASFRGLLPPPQLLRILGCFFAAVPKSQFSAAAGQTEGRLGQPFHPELLIPAYHRLPYQGAYRNRSVYKSVTTGPQSRWTEEKGLGGPEWKRKKEPFQGRRTGELWGQLGREAVRDCGKASNDS